MATVSEVKSGIDSIAQLIAAAARTQARAKENLLAARNQLNNLPSQYADVMATIDAYTPTGAFETLAKDEKAKLASEFVALKNDLETELTALGVSFS